MGNSRKQALIISECFGLFKTELDGIRHWGYLTELHVKHLKLHCKRLTIAAYIWQIDAETTHTFLS